MRLNFRLLMAAFGLLLCTQTVRAQKITQFANDTGKFVRDLNAYFIESAVNKEQAVEYMRNFEKLWNTNVIAGYYKEISIKTSNAMLAKRLKPYPYFYSFFNTIINSINSKLSDEVFDNWLSS